MPSGSQGQASSPDMLRRHAYRLRPREAPGMPGSLHLRDLFSAVFVQKLIPPVLDIPHGKIAQQGIPLRTTQTFHYSLPVLLLQATPESPPQDPETVLYRPASAGSPLLPARICASSMIRLFLSITAFSLLPSKSQPGSNAIYWSNGIWSKIR